MSAKGQKPSRPLRDEITDLPNLLTLARIAMIPGVLLCVDNYSPRLSTLAALIFVLAMATDVLDGFLARRMGLVTVLGKFLDPLADKLMVATAYLLLWLGPGGVGVPSWLTALVLARDLLIGLVVGGILGYALNSSQHADSYPQTSSPPPASGSYQYSDNSCLQEREYQTTVIVGGKEVNAYGTACLQPDGSWSRSPARVANY